jgi:hypothetical protein
MIHTTFDGQEELCFGQVAYKSNATLSIKVSRQHTRLDNPPLGRKEGVAALRGTK